MWVSAHSRRDPKSLAGRARPEPAFDFAAAALGALGRTELRADLDARIATADERARTLVDADDRARAAAEARELRRARLRWAAEQHSGAGAELPGRLDAFAAGLDDAAIDDLAAVLAADTTTTQGGRR